ncbi:MAG: beta-mannosidase [Lachnospiraceae bacterium]|nr:beta-mannosidase [Lachnospiraceae bacterium]
MMKKEKEILSIGLAAMLGVCAAGCAISKTDTPKEPFVPETVGVYEAEDASFTGNVAAVTDLKLAGYSGTGYVEGFQDDSDACTFSVSIAEDGFYDLNFVSTSMGGDKYNYVVVDGEQLGTVWIAESSFSDSVLNRVYLTAGDHEIRLVKYWGWISLDRLEIVTSEPIDEAVYQVTAGLCNPNASDETKRLYSYLMDIYGKKFLSGQYCDTGQRGKEFQLIQSVTGKTPAVLGLDFIEYTPSRVENGSNSMATEFAINFWEQGGIVTFCWHWNAPSKYLTGPWYSGFYNDYTNIDLAKIMNGQDQEGYDLLMADIDAIAVQLQRLEDAGVPILWRPLHEASGGWFWWGASGPEAYKKLYILLYERLTNEYGLDNLIWVWNGQDADWYPGDEYVDIIGEDIYPGERVYTSQAASYLNAANNYSTEYKMVYLSENGCLFDPDLAVRDGAMWGMWCTWGGEFVAKDSAFNTLSEQYTEEFMIKQVYEHEAVITLDELPDFSTYKIRKELK